MSEKTALISLYGSKVFWKFIHDPISIILPNKNIEIPSSVLEEFNLIFCLWNNFGINPHGHSFPKKIRDYFQSINPLSLEDIQKIAEIICEETYLKGPGNDVLSSIRNIIVDTTEYENMMQRISSMERERKSFWLQVIKTSIISKMKPTISERLQAFISQKSEDLLNMYKR